MARSARNSAATKALLEHLGTRATGRLTVGAGAGATHAYLMGGQLVATERVDDLHQLVRMLSLRQLLTEEAARQLADRIEAGEPVFGSLLDAAPAELMDQLLFDRFRQNLCAYVDSLDQPRFDAMKSVFVENIQMGHDSAELLEECCGLVDTAAHLDLDTRLVAGSTEPEEVWHQAIFAKLGTSPRSVSGVLLELPLETTLGRVIMLEMLEAGAALRAEELEEAPTAELSDEDDLELEPLDDTPMGAPEAVGHDAAPALFDPGDLDDSEDDVEDDLDEPTTEAPRYMDLEGDEEVEVPSRLREWLAEATTVDESELDAFDDHDYDRSSSQDGAFSTRDHNLDKVEVAEMATEEIELELEAAPTAKFGAPMLSQEEAVGKIGVANEVLLAVVRAFDKAEGAGRGRSLVQLLVDGGPARFAPLLHDLQITDTGSLPDSHILGNLYARPPTEHRHLLNQALVDIIERALSSAADELPEDSFDFVLESVAGYRQRMGL